MSAECCSPEFHSENEVQLFSPNLLTMHSEHVTLCNIKEMEGIFDAKEEERRRNEG